MCIERLNLIENQNGTFDKGMKLLERSVLITDEGMKNLHERRENDLSVPRLREQESIVYFDIFLVSHQLSLPRRACGGRGCARARIERREVMVFEQHSCRLDTSSSQHLSNDTNGLLDKVDIGQRIDDTRPPPCFLFNSIANS